MKKTTAYQQVYEKIKADILSQVYPVGSLLPTENQLCELFGYSKITIRRAISMLTTEHYVQAKQGQGTVVLHAEQFSEYHKFQNVSSIVEVFSNENRDRVFSVRGMYIHEVKATPTVAEALEVNAGDTIFHIERIIFMNDKPFSLMENFLRKDFFPDLDQYTGDFFNLYDFLQKKYGVYLSTCREYIMATSADLVVAKLLDVAVGSPLLLTQRIAKCNLGPLEYAETKFRTDAYKLEIMMSGNPPNNTM